MIRLFRLDGLELMLNVNMIKDIQPGPPTVVTLHTGERLQVKNSVTDVLTKIHAWRQGLEDESGESAPRAKKSERPRRPPDPRSEPGEAPPKETP